MLAATPDLLAAALADLDPGSRALLDLSLRRGLPDEEIGEFLGTGARAVSERRAEVIDEITREVGGEGPEDAAEVRAGLVDMPAEGWSGLPLPGDAETEPPADEVGRVASSDGTEKVPPGARGAPKSLKSPTDRPLTPGRIAAAVVALLFVAIALVLITISATSDDTDGTTNTETPATSNATTEEPTTTGADQPEGRVARFDSLVGEGRGTARLTDGGQRLDVRIADLPDPGAGRYEIWLYDDIARARSIGSFPRTATELDAPLPANPANYEFIDVSLEPADDNPNHSGETVLRLPTSEL